MCLEMGMHRQDSMIRSFPQADQLSDAINTFWSIYILDRRWSIGIGIPFIIQDDDIDSNLPKPVSHTLFCHVHPRTSNAGKRCRIPLFVICAV